MRERKIIASNIGCKQSSNEARIVLYIIFKILTSDICTTEPKLRGCATAQSQPIYRNLAAVRYTNKKLAYK